MSEDLIHRSEYLLKLLNKFVDQDDTILEIGCGDCRNTLYLGKNGYLNVDGIDTIYKTPIETYPETSYDVIYTMSCLFLIPVENEWVFEKIARMAKKFIVTVEGETTKGGVIGRNYKKIFEKLGFKQIYQEKNVFNEFGIARVFKKV